VYRPIPGPPRYGKKWVTGENKEDRSLLPFLFRDAGETSQKGQAQTAPGEMNVVGFLEKLHFQVSASRNEERTVGAKKEENCAA